MKNEKEIRKSAFRKSRHSKCKHNWQPMMQNTFFGKKQIEETGIFGTDYLKFYCSNCGETKWIKK